MLCIFSWQRRGTLCSRISCAHEYFVDNTISTKTYTSPPVHLHCTVLLCLDHSAIPSIPFPHSPILSHMPIISGTISLLWPRVGIIYNIQSTYQPTHLWDRGGYWNTWGKPPFSHSLCFSCIGELPVYILSTFPASSLSLRTYILYHPHLSVSCHLLCIPLIYWTSPNAISHFSLQLIFLSHDPSSIYPLGE